MRIVAGSLFAAALLAAGAAHAQDDKSREDAMFGAPAQEQQPAPAAGEKDDAAKREDDLFGGSEQQGQGGAQAGPSTEKTNLPPNQVPPGQQLNEGANLQAVDETALENRLIESNDKLAIGARALFQAQFSGRERAVSRGPVSTQPQYLFQGPDLFDLYLDGRPSDRLRAYVRGRLTYTPTAPSTSGAVAGNTAAGSGTGGGTVTTGQPTGLSNLVTTPGCASQDLCVALDQFWLKFDLEKTVFVTVGRQRIKWGAGRFWNPTDFLNPQRLNPFAIFDQRLGVNLVKLHLPIESKSWNFYAIANLQRQTSLPTPADLAANNQNALNLPYRPDQIGGALRAELLLGNVELTTSLAARDREPLRLGADLSGGFWLVDWHVEGALTHPTGPNQLFRYTGTLDASDLLGSAGRVGVEDLDGQWIPQAVAGAEISLKYSDEDSVLLGGEYFYNGLGYEGRSLYPLLLAPGLADINFGGAFLTPELHAVDPNVRPSFIPLYNGRHYFAAYANLTNPGSWNNTSFTLSALGNLSDNSYTGRLDYRITLLTFMSANLFGSYNFGSPGEFKLGFRVPGTVDVPPTIWAVGGGLLVNL